MWRASVAGELVDAWPKGEATRPMCGAPMVAKCGRLVSWHWARRVGQDCDPWAEDETEWHLQWKQRMPLAEKTVTQYGQVHRADAVTLGGTVVEFQHSSLSLDQVQEREAFYERMVWVLDATRMVERIGLARIDRGYYLRWSHPRRWTQECRKPVYLDTGEVLIRMVKPSPYFQHVWNATIGTHAAFLAWAHGATTPPDDARQAGEVAVRMHRDFGLEYALGIRSV